MLTKDKYQEEKEEESLRFIENLLSEVFEKTNRNILVVSDDYYLDRENRLYQICTLAKELNLLEFSCQKYNVEYEFQNYPYNKDSQKFQRGMFIFKRKEKQKELVRTNSLYPKCPHK